MSVNGAAQLLAVIAEQNAGPLTPVLQALCGERIGADTGTWTWDGMTLHRDGTLRAGTLTVAHVTLELDALALPDGAVAQLAAGQPAGTVVSGLRRTWRKALNVLGHPGRDGTAVISSATLELDGQPIGQAAEQITTAFCGHVAAHLARTQDPGLILVS